MGREKERCIKRAKERPLRRQRHIPAVGGGIGAVTVCATSADANSCATDSRMLEAVAAGTTAGAETAAGAKTAAAIHETH